MAGYILIWESMDGQRSKPFAQFSDAQVYAEQNVSPEINGRTIPNIELESINVRNLSDRYEKGMYWLRVNRYAVIISK